MITSEARFTLIEKYLSGDLEKAELDNLLKETPEGVMTQEELNTIRTTIQGVEDAALKDSFRAIHEEEFGSSRSRYLWIGGLAASMALLLSFYFIFNKNETLSPDDLYSSYYETYPNIYSFRGENVDKNYLNMAFDNYTKLDFNKASSLFDSAMQRQNLRLIDVEYAQFYKGQSQLKLQEFEKALSTFENLGSGSKFNEQVTWYRGLVYLMLEQTELAKRELLKVKTDDYKFEESQRILKALD